MEKHFDPAAARKRWNREWEDKRLFVPDDSSQDEPFVITLPPPNVTGVLHVGHILGDTVQDQLIRWKRMNGFNTLWIPGTDHAGIATQKVVENALLKEGKKRSDMTREEFLTEAWKWKEHHHARIVEQMKQLGCAFDWSREAFTLDEARSRAVREAFVRLYEKGLIYRGDYIVNWCPLDQTAISDEEVALVVRDFFVGDGGLVEGAPVDDVVAPINEALLVEADERFAHRARARLVQRERLATPVERAAELLHLFDDARVMVLFPFPRFGEELLARHVAALFPFFEERVLDHFLCGNAGVIGPGNPERVETVHPLPADELVLHRVAQDVADVQHAGDVGRRKRDDERLVL